MLCVFEPIAAKDDSGRRRYRCTTCGITTAPTRHDADRVFCVCRKRDDPTRKMNLWGAEGCRVHRAAIAAWLKESAAATSWLEKAATAAKLIGKSWFNPLDPYGSLVDEAIRRAVAAVDAPPALADA
jgi:transposase